MRLLLIDCQPILRLGLRKLILSRWPGVRIDEADSLDSARGVLSEFGAFDMAILSLPVGGVKAAALTARAASFAKAPILALGAFDSELAAELLALGASGVAASGQPDDELLAAIQRVAAGERYMSPLVADRVVSDLLRAASAQAQMAAATRSLEDAGKAPVGSAIDHARARANVRSRDERWRKPR